jgi:hypothetical protein
MLANKAVPTAAELVCKEEGLNENACRRSRDPHYILAILRFSDDFDPLILVLEIVRFSRFTMKCRPTPMVDLRRKPNERADHHTRVRRGQRVNDGALLSLPQRRKIGSKWKLAAFCRICQDSR